jgi:hypothetical protein
LFARDRNRADEPVKVPFQLESISIKECYYQIKDADNGKTLIDFKTSDTTNATRISCDSNGLFFDIPIDILPNGRSYTINLLVKDRGATSIYTTRCRFRVI